MALFETLELINWTPREVPLASLEKRGEARAPQVAIAAGGMDVPALSGIHADLDAPRSRPRLSGLVALIDGADAKLEQGEKQTLLTPASKLASPSGGAAETAAWDGPTCFSAVRVVLEGGILVALAERAGDRYTWQPQELELMDAIARAFAGNRGEAEREIFCWPPIPALADSPLIQDHLPSVWATWWNDVPSRPVLFFSSIFADEGKPSGVWLEALGADMVFHASLQTLLDTPTLKGQLLPEFQKWKAR